MFLFKISNYDDPALDGEVEELLRQRLEAHSRRTMPGVWKMTDALNVRAVKGPGRAKRRGLHRLYGVLLLALGVFVLAPGLAEPRVPALILAGAVAIVFGLFQLCLARGKRPAGIPSSCKDEAKKLLAARRAVDQSRAAMQIGFDETGMTVSSADNREIVPYGQISEVFGSEHLWLLIYGSEKAVLLQKKDMVSGDPALFASYVLQKAGSV